MNTSTTIFVERIHGESLEDTEDIPVRCTGRIVWDEDNHRNFVHDFESDVPITSDEQEVAEVQMLHAEWNATASVAAGFGIALGWLEQAMAKPPLKPEPHQND